MRHTHSIPASWGYRDSCVIVPPHPHHPKLMNLYEIPILISKEKKKAPHISGLQRMANISIIPQWTAIKISHNRTDRFLGIKEQVLGVCLL